MKLCQGGKTFSHSPEGRAFLHDAASRVKAVLMGAKQRVVGQMAERCAVAMLAGKRMTEVSLQDLPAIKGVEEALYGVLVPVYERGRLEVLAEHERLRGIPADALPPRAGLHAATKARLAQIAQAAAEKFRAHLERAVKRVAAEGCATQKWGLTRFLFLCHISEHMYTLRKGEPPPCLTPSKI